MKYPFQIPEVTEFDRNTIDELQPKLSQLSELALKRLIDDAVMALSAIYARNTINRMLEDTLSSMRSDESK